MEITQLVNRVTFHNTSTRKIVVIWIIYNINKMTIVTQFSLLKTDLAGYIKTFIQVTLKRRKDSNYNTVIHENSSYPHSDFNI